ncbi:hypothetical protein DVH26_17785 [Paenibacillus sp. H1-7]|uniref:heparinase II/III family protein n=1 Tax=Paenibacillus sp. H1-7 TaxID=2282849 RepID=UPI001EF8EDC2|nr:heparinase II/III family protein [Paenibacillus sp. H1-7]ULL16140.1 hypothetical protein DVH26_17785 [Paenibacillus sp. H1-7]
MTGIDQLSLRQLKNALEHPAGQEKPLFPEAANKEYCLRSNRDPRCEAVWDDIRKAGESFTAVPVELLPYSEFTLFHRTGDRTRYDDKYFDRRRRLCVLAMLALADEDAERWIAPLQDIIWAICDEYTWVIPAHVGLYHNEYPNGIWDQPAPPRETVDLFAGETGLALAEIVGLLEPKLEPWIVHRVREEVERRLLSVYFADPAPQNWELKTNNWPAVCAACIGCAAMWLVRDPERLAGMLWRAIHALRQHLQGFDAQGATPEGAAYWQFGFGYYVYFAEMMAERTAGQIDLLAGEKLRRIACFPRSCMLTGSQVINFSDAPAEMDYQPGLYHRLHRRFPEAALPDQAPVYGSAFRSWTMASRMLLWMEPEASEINRDYGVLPFEDYYFPGHGWVISKSEDTGGLVAFAAKGGSNDEPHNHNDLGHFIIHVYGQSVLCDLGAGEYTRQYFQPAYRYAQLTASSHGHSVPVIAGTGQLAGEQYRASPLGYEQTDGRVVYKIDLTRAYPASTVLDRLHREFVWERPQAPSETDYRLTLRDECVFTSGAEAFESVFMCSIPPRLMEPGWVAIGPVRMIYDAERFRCRFTEEHYRSIAGEERMAYRLVLAVIKPSARTVCEVQFEVKGRGERI